MIEEKELNNLKLKLRNTPHYKDAGRTLFEQYIKSFMPKKITSEVSLFFMDYQPISKTIAFQVSIAKVGKFSITINVFVKDNGLDFIFEEYNTKYNLEELDKKKILIDTLHVISNKLSVDKILSLYEKINIIKKEYMALQRTVNKMSEEYNQQKNRRFEYAIKSIFPVKGIELAKKETESYIKNIEDLLNTKYLNHDFQENPLYNILKQENKFYYFEINEGTLYIKDSDIDFNITKNKKINYKLNNTVVSRKKFITALSNQFYINGQFPNDKEGIFQSEHIRKYMTNKYRPECDLEEFAKPLLVNAVANNF